MNKYVYYFKSTQDQKHSQIFITSVFTKKYCIKN